ncbi:MAG: hypothetical protein WC894_04565 [Patescibacteria group bacterium]
MKKNLNIFLIILVFLGFNFIFNPSLWKELSGNKMMVSDNIITEFLVEQSYQNILHMKNPFLTKSIFYPFTTNFSMNDPNTAYVLPFFILRPFFDPHKSILIITLFSFLLNNFFMYLLLRKLKINQSLSIVMALVFGFTPFLSHRILGHYTYIPIYFFPLVFLTVSKLIEAKKEKEKLIISLFLGLSMALMLLINFYYFFMIALGFIFYFSYWFFTNTKQFLQELKKNAIYLLTSIISIIFFLIPWIISVYDLIKTQGLFKSPGFGGAITLSADVLSFFTPSEYNPIYKFLFNKLSLIIPYFPKYNNFFLKSWERFVYPGIIILGIYFSIILLKLLKKFPISLWNKIKPYFLMSLFFAVLMLGPFLKIFNRWSINIEGVAVVFPLPFLLLHYVPGLSTLRAPSRFTPIFIFFSCIVAAYIFDFLIEKVGKKKSLILIIILFVVFFLDQFYVIPTKLNQEIPNKIYNYLNKKPQGTVLEIPFTVRDGFQYIGFVHAIQPMAGQLIHGKPIIGGYIARVPDIFFSYYKNLKFIGYIAKIIDKGNYNPLTEKPKKPVVYKFPYEIDEIKKELDLLNVKYIILKQNEVYTNVVRELIMVSNYRPILTESQYELYEN